MVLHAVLEARANEAVVLELVREVLVAVVAVVAVVVLVFGKQARHNT